MCQDGGAGMQGESEREIRERDKHTTRTELFTDKPCAWEPGGADRRGCGGGSCLLHGSVDSCSVNVVDETTFASAGGSQRLHLPIVQGMPI